MRLTVAEAANMLKVSKRGVERSCFVLDRGIPELVAAVDCGEAVLGIAVEIARLPAETQREVLAAPELRRPDGRLDGPRIRRAIKVVGAGCRPPIGGLEARLRGVLAASPSDEPSAVADLLERLAAEQRQR